MKNISILLNWQCDLPSSSWLSSIRQTKSPSFGLLMSKALKAHTTKRMFESVQNFPSHTLFSFTQLRLRLLLLVIFFAAFSNVDLRAQTCSCNEYLYVNEPNGVIHKMKVNKTDGSLTEVGGANGTPWMKNPGTFPFPHGLGVDRNGFLYIGSNFNSPNSIRKVDCVGNIFPTTGSTGFRAPATGDWGFLLTNINSYEGFIYANGPNNRIYKIDPCTGAQMGYVQLTGSNANDWGLYIDKNGKFYATEPDGKIYAFTPTAANFTSNASFSALIDLNANPSIGGLSPAYDKKGLQGIVTDKVGNIYVIEGNRDTKGTPSRLLKFSATGTFIAAGAIDRNGDDRSGWNQMTGITYSETADRLYTTSLNPNEDCIFRFKTDLTPDGEAVGPVPNAFGQCKAIGILSECCPESETIIREVCGVKVGDRISLSDLLKCEGIVCEGQWAAVMGNTNLTFNKCDLTVTVGSLPACGSFTISNKDVTGSLCRPFDITLNVSYLAEVKAQVIAGSQDVCPTDDPPAFTVTTAASSVPAGETITYQWQSSTTSATSGFSNIAGATSPTYDSGPVSETTYFKVIATIKGCKDGTCSDESNVVILTKGSNCFVCTPPTPTSEGSTICSGSSATLSSSGCDATYISKWYSDAGLTNEVGSGSSFTTLTLTMTTDYYVACVKDATCKSSSVKVTATVVEKPTISGIPTVTQATCNQAGTAANNDAKIEITGIQNGSSYTVDGGASQTLSGNAILLENLPNPAATKVYIIRILNSAATDCFMEFTATLEPKVCTPTCTPPSVSGQGATICAGTSATLTASGCDATYVLKWFSDAGLSNEITTGTNGNNLTTGVLATTTDYYAACVKDASCKSAGAKITATVVEKPTVSVNNGFPACRSNGTAYTIKFTATPAGSVVTAINVATGAGITVTGDSVANVPLTVAKIRLIVANGICRDSIEATAPVCDRPVGSIGDFIFKDINDNGLQDLPAEKGVLGVKLNLYAATGGTKTGSVLQTKTTTNEGKYLFSNLPAGSYIVEIDKTTLPDTCAITTKKDVNANANDETDSDFDATSGLSQVVELAPVFNPTTAAEVLATNNLTVDAGLVKVVLCPKPSYTITTAPNCSANNATYSVSIQITGKLGTVKASAGTISGNNPYTITGIPTGMSLKITDSLSSVCKSDTTIMGPNCNCSPKEPVLLNTSFNVCIGDTFPTLRAMVVGAATVEWFANATGGMAVATGLTYKPEGTVTAAGATFYAQARSTDASCPSATSTSREPASINAQNCAVEIDLALKKFINTKTAKLGDELTYTIKVFNQLDVAATGVEVTDSIATSVQFVAGSFIASRGSASIVGNVIKWNIGDIAASPDTVTLTYKVKAIQQGVHFNTAEISKTNEKDKDSTPNNGKDAEDDLDRQCFTVPIQLCAGEKVEASVPAKYTGVRWFKGGQEQTELAGQNVVLLGDVGSYTFTATNQTCPASGCCPIIIEPGTNCCPANNCVPFTINRGKKK